MTNLPAQGLTERGFIFFHEELSVQDQVWLGGANILGLSRATNGVVAKYTLDGAAAQLVLVQYPAGSQAATALQAVRKAQDVGLLAADVKGALLGAVFGKATPEAAAALVKAALARAQP